MPTEIYPPDSSWHLEPTIAQIRAIKVAARKLPEYDEADIPPTRWQARDLLFDLWARIRSRGKQKKAVCKVLKRHDDGDLTLECDGQRYVTTTEGEVFKEVT